MTGQQHGGSGDQTRLVAWLAFAGTILAAIIGGCFAILAARAGGASDAASAPLAPPQQTSAAAGTTGAGAGPTTGGAPTSGPASLPATTGADVFYQGAVVLQSFDENVDLDRKPPEKLEFNSRADLAASYVWSDDGGSADVHNDQYSAKIALLERGAEPSYEQCWDAANGQGVGELKKVPVGGVLCIRTTEGRAARLVVTKVDAKQKTVAFAAVVWARKA